MFDFCIQIKKNRVKTSRIINGNIELMLFSGEEWISTDLYWEQFKRKVEYSVDEKFAFIIGADIKDFEIDSTILISNEFTVIDEDIKWIVDDFTSASFQVSLYPDISERIKVARAVECKEHEVQTDREVADDSIGEIQGDDLNSLQSFYRKATRDFKRGSK